MNSRLLTAWIVSASLIGACDTSTDNHRIVGEFASDRIELTAEVGEPVTEILVAEGEAVTAGQTLMRQDDTRATARLAESDAALGQAQARLDELVRGPRSEQISAARANAKGARDELAFRGSDYARVQNIYAQKLASPDLLDRAKAALDAARANEQMRRAQLQELLSGTTIEQLAQAESAVKQAVARSELLAVDLARHQITAPVDGIVDSRLFELGERPSPGQAMLIMLSGAQPHARVYVPEHLRVHVKIGMPAMLHVDGLDAAIGGRVRWVASEPAFTPYFALTERDRGHLTYVAKIDIVDERERLPDGLPVEVDLMLSATDE
jgi:HlyD family secretion protein